jgi:hypothetical protein
VAPGIAVVFVVVVVAVVLVAAWFAAARTRSADVRKGKKLRAISKGGG